MALAACGCFGGGDKSRSSSKSRFGSKGGKEVAGNKKQKQKQGKNQPKARPADYQDLTPEVSMRQGYDRLKETETMQLRVVEEMRNALAQGEEAMRLEENKLAQIQRKISDYEVAMQRYTPPSGPRPGRAAQPPRREDHDIVAASMYSDPRGQRPDSRAVATRSPGYDSRGQRPDDRREYAPRTAPAHYDGGYDRRPASYAGPQENRYPGREETLYDPRANDYRGPRVNDYRSVPPQRREEPAYPANRDPRYDSRGSGWDAPGSLYSDAAPRQSTGMKNTLRPEPRLQAPAPVPMETSVPAAGATTQSRAPVRPPEPETPANHGSDEVFTPDLYLSGGR